MATISDVAKRARVSPVTVSRVLNGAQNVSPDTRAKVEEAIQELGYLPNLAARSLRSRQTRTLALLVPDITNAFWTTVARGVEDAAQGGGYSVLLCNTDESPTKQANYLRVVLQQRVDGVIIAPYDADVNNLSQLRDLHIPTVVIDRRIDGWEVDTVASDSVAGARTMVQHLISLGHRQIAIISGPVSASTAEDRVAGACLALYQAGLAIDSRLIRWGVFRRVSGYKLTQAMFAEGLQPSAIFATNNLMAMGVLEAIRDHGLRVPQDVALVSFDDLPDVASFLPFMTVVSQPAYDMGMNAAQLLLSRINVGIDHRAGIDHRVDGSLPPRHVTLPTRLIMRQSCGRTLSQEDPERVGLPPVSALQVQTVLVKPLSAEEKAMLPECAPGGKVPVQNTGGIVPYDRKLDQPDVNRLVKALRFLESDRLPHVELQVTSKEIFAWVLERSLAQRTPQFTPGEHVEFAQRLGIDAIPCTFDWRPGSLGPRGERGNGMDRARMAAAPTQAEQIDVLENYLRASQGTGVGIFIHFNAYLDGVFKAVCGEQGERLAAQSYESLENHGDALLRYQEKALRLVCDRFAGDLAFILINDETLGQPGITSRARVFLEWYLPSLARLIEPAKEHGILVGLRTPGKLEKILPALHEHAFDLVLPATPEANNLAELKRRWYGKLSLAGGLSTSLLVNGHKDQIEAQVRQLCTELRPGGGFVLSSSAGVPEGTPPENFMALIKAVHQCR